MKLTVAGTGTTVPVQFPGLAEPNLDFLRKDVVIWRVAGLRIVVAGAERDRDAVGRLVLSLACSVGPASDRARAEIATADILDSSYIRSF